MKCAKDDDEEDHLEEGDKDVGGGNHQTDDAQNCRYGALVKTSDGFGLRSFYLKYLADWQAEAVEAVPHPVVGGALAVHVAVGDVRRKVHGEPNAHDQVDH